MASIVWREDRCKWYAYFYRENGRKGSAPIPDAPATKSISKRERALIMAAAERIAEDNAPVAADEIDIETCAGHWLKDVKTTCSMRTYERYRSTAKTFLNCILPAGKRMPARSISMDHIRRFRDHRTKTSAAATVINDMKCLHAMFEWIRKQRTNGTRWIPENPCEDVEYPKRDLRKVVFPSDAEVKRMLDLLEGKPPEFRALGILGAFAGMRRNEILLLRWDWVDLERKLLYVHGKSKQPRPVPMHSRVDVFLASLPREGEMCLPSPYAETGQQRSPYAAREFNDWLRECGFGWTHHGLRRWFNDRLRQLTGLSSSARRLVVGHEDEATNRLYQNPQAEEARPFVTALEP